mmetsp:Transcript_113807/g.170228  ORF Transcript_113807/g.170228 Transcript_113807/m.170228 type:complete len:297 (+) Transcript_113807:79-969(+)
MVLSTTSQGTNYLRMAKVPQGPTLTYRIEKFCLTKDIHNSQVHPHSPGMEYNYAPLVVMNGFSSQETHMKLVSSLWQSAFPPINVQKTKVMDCKRVVLLDYDKKTGVIEFRHYVITVVPHGVSKGVKRLVNRKQELPNLENYTDISEYINSARDASESDIEDGAEAEVTVPKGNSKGPLQMAVRLVEMGPRMQLKLMKIQEGFCAGDILYQDAEDKSSSGADASLMDKKGMKEDDKEKEKKRIDMLAPDLVLPAKRRLPKKSAGRKRKTKPDTKSKSKTSNRAEEGAPERKRARRK